MSIDLFTLSWFVIFVLVILIAFLANIIIILAILRDKSMHTSTYYYIINVNIADIMLVLSCLPERITEIFGSTYGFHLGMITCYLLPFFQQVSMHAALAFLLILTVHRCYPAGVPRFLQGDFIRRQIRNHFQTLCFLWTFALLINLPLFAITKYENIPMNVRFPLENHTTLNYTIMEPNCFTGANELWSRTYLILLLVLTYLITGIFLIVIYGQVIRIILASKKFTQNSNRNRSIPSESYRYLSPNQLQQDRFRSKISLKPNENNNSSTSSASQSANPRREPTFVRSPLKNDESNSHSTQHLQVIVMLFIVILLYILLLLPYRLFNLLYIVHNQLFQQSLMNEVLFSWLLNIVRFLVFLNCALQPITYLIISSRLRQTVLKFLRSIFRCSSSHSSLVDRNEKNLRPYSNRKSRPITINHPVQKIILYRETRPIQTSLNNINQISLQGFQGKTPASTRSTSPVAVSRLTNRTLYTVSFLKRSGK